MTTPLCAALTRIADDWEATTPPDRVAVTYHESDGRRLLEGVAGDRAFSFGFPSRVQPDAERGPDMTHVRWRVPVVVRFGGSGRSLAARTDAIANEINLLARKIELRSVWPSGVLEVVTGSAEPQDEDPDTGDVEYGLDLEILTEETDT